MSNPPLPTNDNSTIDASLLSNLTKIHRDTCDELSRLSTHFRGLTLQDSTSSSTTPQPAQGFIEYLAEIQERLDELRAARGLVTTFLSPPLERTERVERLRGMKSPRKIAEDLVCNGRKVAAESRRVREEKEVGEDVNADGKTKVPRAILADLEDLIREICAELRRREVPVPEARTKHCSESRRCEPRLYRSPDCLGTSRLGNKDHSRCEHAHKEFRLWIATHAKTSPDYGRHFDVQEQERDAPPAIEEGSRRMAPASQGLSQDASNPNEIQTWSDDNLASVLAEHYSKVEVLGADMGRRSLLPYGPCSQEELVEKLLHAKSLVLAAKHLQTVCRTTLEAARRERIRKEVEVAVGAEQDEEFTYTSTPSSAPADATDGNSTAGELMAEDQSLLSARHHAVLNSGAVAGATAKEGGYNDAQGRSTTPTASPPAPECSDPTSARDEATGKQQPQPIENDSKIAAKKARKRRNRCKKRKERRKKGGKGKN